MKSKSVLGAVAAIALFTSSAIAAETATTAPAPLPAGKAAGTKEAAMITPGWGVIIIAVGIATFVAIAATGGFNSSESASGTTS